MGDHLLSWLRDELADLSDGGSLFRFAFRLTLAAVLGGVLGYQRAYEGKAAGLRTHMLVTLGAALLLMVLREASNADLSRVIQGIVTGIGFLGAGAILKSPEEKHIRGLTTAAGIWLAAGIGVAAGAGRAELAVLATLAGLIVLSFLQKMEQQTQEREPSAGPPKEPPPQ